MGSESPLDREIDGIPLPRTFIARRELAPETRKALELRRAMQILMESEKNVRYFAYHDSMTGLPNRRAFEEAFEESVSTAITKGEKLALAIGDVDGLKSANDQYGHKAGDEAIVAAAGVLQRESRQGDAVFRIGGDEFAIILPGYDSEDDSELISRLRSATESVTQKIGLPVGTVSLSVGIARYEGESPQEFFKRADADLYRRKPPREGDSRMRPFIQSE